MWALGSLLLTGFFTGMGSPPELRAALGHRETDIIGKLIAVP